MKQVRGKYWGAIILLLILLMGYSGCHNQPGNQQPVLRVAAAASLINVVQKVDSLFKGHHPRVTIEPHFAASSILARQLERGAPFDVFLSADPEWIEYLAHRKKINSASITIFARNQLVIITPGEENIQEPLKDWIIARSKERIALADWHHVPAGKYARFALEKMGLWQPIMPYIIPAMDVRAALAYVERGDAAVGIVYQSDALISNKINFQPLPQAVQPTIIYEGATVQTNDSLALTYLKFLTTDEAQAIFQHYGFQPLLDSVIN